MSPKTAVKSRISTLAIDEVFTPEVADLVKGFANGKEGTTRFQVGNDGTVTCSRVAENKTLEVKCQLKMYEEISHFVFDENLKLKEVKGDFGHLLAAGWINMDNLSEIIDLSS